MTPARGATTARALGQTLTERYEQLRSQVLCARHPTGHEAAGVGVVIRSGLCAWMQSDAWSSPPPARVSRGHRHRRVEPMHAELGRGIADILLQPVGSARS